MDEVIAEAERLKGVLEDLRSGLGRLDSAISAKQREFQQIEASQQKSVANLERLLSEREDLERVLTGCAVDVCKYKAEFAAIKTKHGAQASAAGQDRDFHFFLCFRNEYSPVGSTVIEAHREVIGKYRYCWWGKFAAKRKPSGAYESLEPFGESIDCTSESLAAGSLRERVLRRRENGDPVYLYLCDPNLPSAALYAAKVEDFLFGEGRVPYIDREGARIKDCEKIPDYYFETRANCTACKKKDDVRCLYRYQCNFWFRVSDIIELKDIGEEFANLISAFTDDSVNFAIPILYPLLVYQRQELFYFHEKDQPTYNEKDIDFRFKSGEGGHTDIEKVKVFFNRLNAACGRCIYRVDSLPFSGKQEDSYSVGPAASPDQIHVDLPGEYRLNRSPSSYLVHLDRRTTARQRSTALEMMRDHLDSL